MTRHLIPPATPIFSAAGHHGSSNGAPIWDLIKVTASSILEVVILSFVGYLLARRGIIDRKTQTKINKINVSVFTPALLFSKVAFTLNPRRLAELLIVPIGFVLVTLVSTLAAWLLAGVARLSKAQRNFALACAISPNSNSLPVALMQALVIEVPQLHWDVEGEEEDTVNGMLGRALTYLVLYSTLGMFLRWSVGAKLLSTVEDDTPEPTPTSFTDEPRNAAPRTGRLVDYEGASEDNPHINITRPSDSQNDSPRRAPEPLTDGGDPPVRRSNSGPPAWARSFPNTPRGSRPGSLDGDEVDEDEQAGVSTGQTLAAHGKNVFRKVVIVPASAVNAFMTAPLWAATASLVVALIHPLQVFLDSLEPVVGALETAGACSIPLTMLVLGAYFIEEKQAVDQLNKQDQPATAQPSHSQGPPSSSTDTDDTWRQSSRSQTLPHDLSKRDNGSAEWMKNPWKSGSSTAGSEAGSAYDEGTADQNEQQSLLQNNTSANARGSENSGPLAALRPSNWRRSSSTLTPSEKTARHRLTMERRTIAVAIVSRMILTPLILIPAVAWYAISTRQNVVDDPVFIASACLIIGSPPALTLAQITSQKATGNSGFERLISKTIFVSYAILAAPTTILLVMSALIISENDHRR